MSFAKRSLGGSRSIYVLLSITRATRTVEKARCAFLGAGNESRATIFTGFLGITKHKRTKSIRELT
jgi:hypothetical protein